jgi:hypothetical protein
MEDTVADTAVGDRNKVDAGDQRFALIRRRSAFPPIAFHESRAIARTKMCVQRCALSWISLSVFRHADS